MDGDALQLRKKLDDLLREAAEGSVALDRADGTTEGVPHYSVIEARAHELGQQLSRQIQERRMAEIVAAQVTKGTCPGGGRGRGLFSTHRPGTPGGGGWTRDVLEVSAKTIQRGVHDVGRELEQRRDGPAKTGDPLARRAEEPPDLAVVECDGGRIRMRQPGHGPGVHLSGEGWREDKNACLIRAKRRVFSEDPQPDPPACFCDPKHAAKIAETEALSAAALLPGVSKPVQKDDQPALHGEDWRPKRLGRTVLSSVASSEQFGRQLGGEANQ